MTLTIENPAEVETALADEAGKPGMNLQAWVEHLTAERARITLTIRKLEDCSGSYRLRTG